MFRFFFRDRNGMEWNCIVLLYYYYTVVVTVVYKLVKKYDDQE